MLGDIAHAHLVGPFAHVSIGEREVSHALKDRARVGCIVGRLASRRRRPARSTAPNRQARLGAHAGR